MIIEDSSKNRNSSQSTTTKSKNYADAVNRVHLVINMVERVKSVERRLRSIEQSGKYDIIKYYYLKFEFDAKIL